MQTVDVKEIKTIKAGIAELSPKIFESSKQEADNPPPAHAPYLRRLLSMPT